MILSRPISGKLWKPAETLIVARGTGQAQLGISAPADESPARGPNAISLLGGRILVVDGENKRAVRFMSSSARTIIPMKHARTVTDIVSLGDAVVAFDASRGRMTLVQESGRAEDIAGARIEKFQGIEAISANELVVRSATKSFRYKIDEEEDLSVPRAVGVKRTRRIVRAPTEEKNVRGVKIRGEKSITTYRSGGATKLAVLSKGDDPKIESSVELSPPIPGELVSVTQLGSDTKNRIYVRLEILESKSPLKVRKFIRVLDSKLATLDDIEIPVAGVIVPEKDIAIGEDGTIAILVPTADRTTVVRLSPP
jgi:hypothetical protein